MIDRAVQFLEFLGRGDGDTARVEQPLEIALQPVLELSDRFEVADASLAVVARLVIRQAVEERRLNGALDLALRHADEPPPFANPIACTGSSRQMRRYSA